MDTRQPGKSARRKGEAMSNLPKYFYFRVKATRKGTAIEVEDASDCDVVEVVRCCNCEWSKESSGRLFCTNGYNARTVDPYGFCEKGKR